MATKLIASHAINLLGYPLSTAWATHAGDTIVSATLSLSPIVNKNCKVEFLFRILVARRLRGGRAVPYY